MLGAAKTEWQTLKHRTQRVFRTCDSRLANPFKAVLLKVSSNQVELLSYKHTSATQPGQICESSAKDICRQPTNPEHARTSLPGHRPPEAPDDSDRRRGIKRFPRLNLGG
jgi:hypothetical protein